MLNLGWDDVFKIIVVEIPLLITIYGVAIKAIDSSTEKAKEKSAGGEKGKQMGKNIDTIEREMLDMQAHMKENARLIIELQAASNVIRDTQAKNLMDITNAILNGTKRS